MITRNSALPILRWAWIRGKEISLSIFRTEVQYPVEMKSLPQGQRKAQRLCLQRQNRAGA